MNAMRTAKVSVLEGQVKRLAVSRTFTDGQLFSEIAVEQTGGGTAQLQAIFCTNKLLSALTEPGTKQIYLWQNHIFAIKGQSGFQEDLKGTRYSFMHRDELLLVILGCTVILLPYVAWVVGRKLIAVTSFPKSEGGYAAS